MYICYLLLLSRDNERGVKVTFLINENQKKNLDRGGEKGVRKESLTWKERGNLSISFRLPHTSARRKEGIPRESEGRGDEVAKGKGRGNFRSKRREGETPILFLISSSSRKEKRKAFSTAPTEKEKGNQGSSGPLQLKVGKQ